MAALAARWERGEVGLAGAGRLKLVPDLLASARRSPGLPGRMR